MASLSYAQLLSNWSSTKSVPTDYFYDAGSNNFFGPPNFDTVITPTITYSRADAGDATGATARSRFDYARAATPNSPGSNDDSHMPATRQLRPGRPVDTRRSIKTPYVGTMADSPGTTVNDIG